MLRDLVCFTAKKCNGTEGISETTLLQNPITYNPSILLVFKQSYSGKLKTMHRLPKGMVHLEKKTTHKKI